MWTLLKKIKIEIDLKVIYDSFNREKLLDHFQWILFDK